MASYVSACLPAAPSNEFAEPLVAHTAAPLTAAASVPDGYVLLAKQTIVIGERSTVTGGNVGVAAGVSGAVGKLTAKSGSTVSIGLTVRVEAAVLEAQSRIGDLAANDVQLGAGAVTGTRSPYVAPPAAPSVPAVNAGSTAVTVNSGQTRTLGAGKYGVLTVNGTLHLSGGLYEVKSIRLGANARLNANNRATVRIATGLSAGDGARVTTAVSQHTTDLQLMVAGSIDADGNAIALGNNVRFTGVVLASKAFRAGHHLIAGGAIAASQIFLGADSQVNLGCGCDEEACGDGDACGTFACVAGLCQRTNAPDGTTCGPGDACSTQACGAGLCQRTNAPDGTTCGPGDACSTQACGAGVCRLANAPDDTACSDSNACTVGDSCQAGVCASGEAMVTEYPTGMAQPTALTPGPDGNLWFISAESLPGAMDGTVARLVPATGTLSTFPTARRLLDIKAGPDGNMWLAERLPAPGGQLSALGRLTTAGLFLEELVGIPADKIAAGPDNNQWFVSAIGDANIAGGIRPVDGLIVSILLVTNRARHMTGGPDGNVWLTESNGGVGPALIGRIAPDSTLTEFAVDTPGDLNVITVGPDGNLWFTDEGQNEIGRVTPSGAVTKFAVPTAGSGVHGIVAGPDGNLWFTERNTNKIGRITPAGAVTELGCIPSAASGPTSIATGADGRVWFTQSAAGNVAALRIP